jgi:hypothetical protein
MWAPSPPRSTALKWPTLVEAIIAPQAVEQVRVRSCALAEIDSTTGRAASDVNRLAVSQSTCRYE